MFANYLSTVVTKLQSVTYIKMMNLQQTINYDHMTATVNFTVDYQITGLGLLTYTFSDGRKVYVDPLASTQLVMTAQDVIPHISTMRKRLTNNLRFMKADVEDCLKSVANVLPKRAQSFFDAYATILAELYPKEDIAKMLFSELLASMSTKGLVVPRLFENFFTLLLTAQPTPVQFTHILEILPTSDVEKLQQLYGVIAMFPQEQVFEFFTNFNEFSKNLKTTSEHITTASQATSEAMTNLKNTLGDTIEAIKKMVNPESSTIETLGVLGRILYNTYLNFPYVVAKIAMIITQGCTIERLVDLLSITGMLPYLLSKFGSRISHLLFGSPEEQMNLSSVWQMLTSPDGLMNFWKVDRGITGIMNLVNNFKWLLVQLGLIKDADHERLIELTSRLDDIEDNLIAYKKRQVEEPRSLLDPTHLKVIDSYQKDLHSIYSTLENIKDITHRNRCALLKADMQKLYMTVLTMQRQSNSRVEPFAVCLLGAGGIGKSSLMASAPRMLSSRVQARQRLPIENPQHLPSSDLLNGVKNWQCWSENQGDQYASGYNEQEIHNVDDAFQDREDKDHPKYFNLISPVPYPTNQAGLENKGKPYTSRLIQASANHFPHRSETIRDIKALARRFQLIGVRFNGTDAQYQEWLNRPRDDFDDEYRHLNFYHMSGFDYVNDAQHHQEIGGGRWRRFSLTQYLDLMIDGILAKQIMFEQRIGPEEQAASSQVIDMNNWGSFYDPRCTKFTTPTGSQITDIVVNGTDSFRKTMLVSRFGSYPAKEFTTEFDITRVIACIGNDHPKHIGKTFKSTIPVHLQYVSQGMCTTINLGVIGPDFDIENVGVAQTPLVDEDAEQYPPDEPLPKSFYAQLRDGLMKVFNGAKDIVLWVLYAIKNFIFPDMTNWSECDYFLGVMRSAYLTTLIFSVVFSFFFGVQMLGDVPVCTGCAADAEKNYDLIVQWVIMNRIHKKTCGYFFCSEDCKWLKTHRFNGATNSCPNTVGVLVWKRKCAYSSGLEEVKQAQEVFKRLYKIDPEIMNAYQLTLDIMDRCNLPESEFNSWFRQITNSLERNYLAKTAYINVQEEGEALKQLIVDLVNVATVESGDSKRIIRKKAAFESGDSKRIIRRSARIESGDSKKIIRKKPRFESGVQHTTRKPIEFSDGTQATADTRMFGPVMDEDALKALNTEVTGYPPTGLQVAEEYGLRLQKINPEVVKLENATEQASSDPGCRPMGQAVCDSIVYVLSDTNKTLLHGVPIDDKYFVVPSHMTRVYPVGMKFEVMYKGTVYDATCLKARPEWDLAICEIKGTSMKSQRKHIPTEDELLDRTRANSMGLLMIPNRDSTIMCLQVYMQLHKEYTISFQDGDKQYDGLWIAKSMIGISAETRAGDCGSPVFLLCPKTAKKLVGFHIVGARTYSAFAVLTQERITSFLASVEKPEQQINFTTQYPVFETPLFSTVTPPTSDDPVYAPVGEDKTIIGHRVFESPSGGKTNIKEHPCHGVFPVNTKPAYLDTASYNEAHPDEPLQMEAPNGDIVSLNLVTKNTSKWAKKLPETDLITEELEEMEEELGDYWAQVFQEEDLSMIPMEDAVSGNPAFDLDPINFKSSPGIPWNKMKGIHSKVALLEETGKTMINGARQRKPVPELEEAVQLRLQKARQGERVFSIWKDCLKDETRPIPKVEQGKTRIFTAAPVDFTVAIRVMMGRFKTVWQKKGHELGHSVGIDCLSADWARLYHRLSAVSNRGFDCDYSNYDGNLRADFMRSAINIFARTIANRTFRTHYGVKKEEVEEMIKLLCSECIETFQQSGDTIWMSHHGNPSGNPLTTEINCTVNFMYHWFCFRQILGKDNCSLKDFLDRVGFTCFGDDAVYVFQDVDKITFEELSKWMKYLGQDYTNAAKTGSDSALLHITQLSFLKRGFKPSGISEHVIYSPIEEDSILGQFNWCAYGEDAVDILQDTFENSLVEMAQVGKEQFNNLVTKLHPVLSNHLKTLTGVYLPRPRYNSYMRKLLQIMTK